MMKSRYTPISKQRASWMLLFFVLTFAEQAFAQPNTTLKPVITTGLNGPMQFVHAGDGSNRVFIVQKAGSIRVYDPNFQFLSNFVTVNNISTNGERGLLSMAFHPDYKNNGLFYVYYTNASGDLELARYEVSNADPNVADASSKVILITIPHPNNSNHNGGELHFGSDGFLYLSTGDGGGGGDQPNNAQNTSVLLGKILRFAVNTSATAPYYTIPAGNPYGNEIYALGLRNPYRWSFDRQTGDMWIGDVGQDSWEEINYRPASLNLGANYGWRCYEGNAAFNTSGCSDASAYVFPAYAYASQNPAASITGGVVYRGTAYPTLQGYYLSADFYSGIFYKLIPNPADGWITTMQTLNPTGIVDFGETENGEVYVISHTGNSVYQVTDTSSMVGINDPGKSKEYARVYPSMVSNGFVHVYLPASAAWHSFEVMGIQGERLMQVSLSGKTGEISVDVQKLGTGMYVCRVIGQSGVVTQKIYIP
jgi:glucose/arabinose dehydrogenase